VSRADSGTGEGIDAPAPKANRRFGSLIPADKVIIAYLATIAGLVALSAGRIRYWWVFLAAHAAAIAGIVLIAGYHRRAGASPRSLSGLLHAWYALVLVPLTYKELTYLIPLVHPRDFDRELAAIDYRVFGVHPTVWLERLTTPLLTEILQLSYIAYYFLPFLLGVTMWRKGWFHEFHFFLFVIVLGFYLSYLGYIAVPAIGPRFILADHQTVPLAGIWMFERIRVSLDQAEGITRDCFPSGHVELSLLVLYYAHRFHRGIFWWVLPAVSALIISTVYLRYHYVIDVVAGALLAALIVAAAGPLYRVLGGGSRGRGPGAWGQGLVIPPARDA
jgi:membrane-associated phospholipid phosphatase